MLLHVLLVSCQILQRLWKGHGSMVGPWQPATPADLHSITLWIQVMWATELFCFPVGFQNPSAQFGLPACVIPNVSHLHIAHNQQTSTGLCLLWLATVTHQFHTDFAKKNNKSWHSHLLPRISAVPFPHTHQSERVSGRKKKANTPLKSLCPKSESDRL